MPTYIMLSTLTPEGVQTVKNNPQRILEVNKEVEQLGASVKAQWATLGHVDFISVIEAPDAGDDGARLAGARLARVGPLRDARRDPDRRLHLLAVKAPRAASARPADVGRARPREPARVSSVPLLHDEVAGERARGAGARHVDALRREASHRQIRRLCREGAAVGPEQRRFLGAGRTFGDPLVT